MAAPLVPLLVLALASIQASSAAAPVGVSVGMGATAFQHIWKRSVGSGHALLGTRADWQRHLQMVRNDLGFEGVRMHGLLDDDMSIVMQKQNGGKGGVSGGYSFYNVDLVYDYLVGIGMKPVVELSFMPCAFTNCSSSSTAKFKREVPATYTNCELIFTGLGPGSYKGCQAPPNDWQDWHDLVKATAEHLVERYGLAEVASWDFEIWCQPPKPCSPLVASAGSDTPLLPGGRNEMWGMPFPHPYMTLYSTAAAALKAVHPSLRVGGPATMCLEDVATFVGNATAMKLPVDFVSTHACERRARFFPTSGCQRACAE